MEYDRNFPQSVFHDKEQVIHMPEKGLQVVSGNLEKMKKMIKETEQAPSTRKLLGNQKAIEENGVILARISCGNSTESLINEVRLELRLGLSNIPLEGIGSPWAMKKQEDLTQELIKLNKELEQALGEMTAVSAQDDLREAEQWIAELFADQPPNDVATIQSTTHPVTSTLRPAAPGERLRNWEITILPRDPFEYK